MDTLINKVSFNEFIGQLDKIVPQYCMWIVLENELSNATVGEKIFNTIANLHNESFLQCPLGVAVSGDEVFVNEEYLAHLLLSVKMFSNRINTLYGTNI